CDEDADWISIYLHYSTAPTNAGEVKAEFKISLLDHDRQPVALYSRCSQGFGYQSKFQDFPWLPRISHVVVPPSNMHHHLGQLLLAGEAADVTFEVGEETFAAHRCILAARSPVFKAELLGPMKEKTATRVLIDDMEARVFKALLHFIYTDSLPAMDEGGAAEIAQHLLVAADRYDMERLKLICEGKLCDHICKSTVATTLALAEQHGCGALKKACFKFLMSPGNLKVVMESDGYEHLRSSCPSVLDELVAKLAP
ncbi:hypothetical protein CFC21_110965, partial [Triticum aestivum]